MAIKDDTKRKEAQRRADAKRAGTRARAWTAVIYPESAAEGWQELLADSLVEALVSPLHDKDVEPTGEPKKPHYHIVLSFKNPTSYDKAKSIFDTLNAVTPPAEKSKVKDFRQMARYLCHLDQPNKADYSMNDVQAFGGLDYQSIVMSGADEDDMIDAIEDFIYRNRIVSFTDFQRYVRTKRPEWRYIVRHKYSYYIRETIKANAWNILNGTMIDQSQKPIEDWE